MTGMLTEMALLPDPALSLAERCPNDGVVP